MAIRALQLYHTARRKISCFGPTLVFIATFVLMAVSITGTVVAFSVYDVQDSEVSIGASQSLTLLSSAVSFIFIGLYLLAVRRDEPVSKSRPPTIPLHGACFIIIRITFLLWTAALLTALATTFNNKAIQKNTTIFKLQRIDIVTSILAILAAIVIVMGLETCDKPFKIPYALIFRPKIVCRVSCFDEFLEHSVSRRPSFEHSRRLDYQKSLRSIESGLTLLENSSVSDTPTPLPKDFSCTKTLLEDPQVLIRYTVGSKRVTQSSRSETSPRKTRPYSRYLSQPGRCIALTSISSHSEKPSESLGWTRTCESNGSLSRASPTSSISMASHRSPLSTVRNVENPEVQVNTELYICPLLYSYAVNGSEVSPVPVKNITNFRRRISKDAHGLDLRRCIAKSKSMNKGIVAERHAVFYSSPNPPNPRLEVTNSLSQQSTLDGHFKIIEDRISAAVLRQLQEVQRLRDRTDQWQLANAESGYLRHLESRGSESQECIDSVSTFEPLNEVFPVLPKMDFHLETIGLED